MADKDEVRTIRSETSGEEGSTATVASSVEDRMRILMESNGFFFEEAQAALTPDPLIPRPGETKDMVPAFRSSRGSQGAKARSSHVAKVKTTHLRPSAGSGSRSPHPHICNSLAAQHQGDLCTEEHLFGRSVATYPGFSAGKITHPAWFVSPDPVTNNTVETVSDNCDSCGGECVYSVPLQKATGTKSKTPRNHERRGDTDAELTDGKIKCAVQKTSGKQVARTARIELDMPTTTTVPAKTRIKDSLPMRASVNVKFLEDPISWRSKRGRTVENHFPASLDAYRQHTPAHSNYVSGLDPSKTEILPPTLNTKPAENSRARSHKPRRAMGTTRSAYSSLAEVGSQNSEESKPGSLTAFADEARSQAASTRKKEDIIKVMRLGVEWDVVGKDEAGEDDWLVVDVDEATAKIKFMKIEAEKL